ncbi:hypothetical protein HYT52_00875 [Candidatus Woesearchaeota archaeon]|nr:hypothetical protein [Candidatus Woesearchaeota archaeon]
MKDGIPTFGSVVGSTIVNNTIYTEGNNSNHGIFIHTNYNYTSIINNRIYTNGSGGNNYGIFISDHAYFTNVTNNLIYTNGTGFDYGIYVHNSSSNTFIMNNTIHTYGSSSNYGIFLSLETNSSRIINNSIYTNGTGGNNYGIVINDSVFFTNITGNTISTNGTSFNYGISISSASENILESNLITPDGSASGNDGVRIEGTSSSNVLLNNTILGDSATQSIIDANSSTTNTLLYKNSFGQINWTLANLTANISLAIGNTIFIESNKVGLTDDAQALNLDGPARIELRNLAFTTPQLLKDGDVCSTPSCNISYDSVTDIIYANVSSFSNYSARETPGTASDSEGSSSSGSGSGGGSCASGYHVVDGECVKATVEEEIQEDQKVDEKESGKEDGYIDQDEDGSRDLLIEEDSATSEEFVKPEDRGKAFAGMAFFDGLFTSTGDLSTPLIALLVLLFLAVVISLIVGMMKRGKKKYYPLVPLNQTGRDIYLQNRLAILKSKLQMAKDQKVVELESKQTLEEKAGLLRETIRKKQMILEQEKADKFKQAELGARQRIVDRQARILELHPRQEENLLLERERLELKRSEQEKLEQERLGLRRSEHERLEPERLNLKRLEQERLERRMNELKRLIEAKKKNSRM